jgi:DNA-binding winged helix-turn-helix (wHTH) protein/tetratricopeptide (TPR) repeat protein
MKDLQFAGFRIDGSRRQLLRGVEAIALPSKAFDLLSYMAANPGRLLSKDELLRAVWPDSFVEESNLTQNVFLLRRALKGGAQNAILTVPGRGYQFAARVAEVMREEMLERSSPVAGVEFMLDAASSRVIYQEETEESVSLRRSPLGLAIAGVTLLAVGVAGWLGWERWQDHVGGPPVQVVLADLEGGTGDAILDRTLNNVMRLELAQSPFVTVVPVATVQTTLAQMTRKPGDLLTASLAREVCERAASQAVLSGTVARAGAGYVLTEQAINCVDGSVVAAYHREVAGAEQLPAAIQKAAATIRHGLGESRRTISRFDAPLLPVTTGSLDALKDFTQASILTQRGHMPEAIELLKQAVQLDPKFATAYLNLSLLSTATLANDDAVRYVQKAYELREASTEPTRFFILARYHSLITQDLYEALRNYQAWVNLYPRSPQPWSGLQNVNFELGRYQDSLVAARQAQHLLPDNAAALKSLADAEMRTGNLAAAQKTCELALSKGLDVEIIRYLLYRIARLEGNDELLQAQERWLKDHPDSPVLLINEGESALSQGQFAVAGEKFEAMSKAFAARGQSGAGVALMQRMALAYAELGQPERARELLHRAPVGDTEEELLTLIDIGEGTAAEAQLKKSLAVHPQSTVLTQDTGPIVRGKLAMISGRPLEAIRQLESTRNFTGQGVRGFYMRGLADMQAGQFTQAEAEFRGTFAHPEIDPFAFELPMARLQLARALAAEGKSEAATQAYQEFLERWKNADSGSATLKSARAELASLSARHQL